MCTNLSKIPIEKVFGSFLLVFLGLGGNSSDVYAFLKCLKHTVLALKSFIPISTTHFPH